MSFTPNKAKKEPGVGSSIQGLAFRTIGAAMSTTPSMSVSVNKDGNSSYVSMLGYLSETLPGPRSSWDGELSGGGPGEDCPYENVESLLNVVPRRSVKRGHNPATQQRHSAESAMPRSRPPVYENISDFIRSSEIELRYTSYDTLPMDLVRRSSGPLRDQPMYDSTPCLSTPEPLYDTTPANRKSAAVLYDSIPCTINPPPLEDFHFRPLPNIKDKHGTFKKLFSLPKRFHRKKPSKLEKHPSMDALNELPRSQQNSFDMVVSMEGGGNMDVHASIKQGSLTRHASVEVLLNATSSQGVSEVRQTKPPATPPPPPKPPRVGQLFDIQDRYNNTKNEASNQAQLAEGKTMDLQHELRIALEQRLSQLKSEDDMESSAMRRRAASCSNLASRSSGPYDKPWDLKRNQLMPPSAESLFGVGLTAAEEDTSKGGMRARSASLSDVSSTPESLCSPKPASTPTFFSSTENTSKTETHSGNEEFPEILSKTKINSSMMNLSPCCKLESVSAAKGAESGKSKSMLDLTPQQELKLVLAERARRREALRDVNMKNGTDETIDTNIQYSTISEIDANTQKIVSGIDTNTENRRESEIDTDTENIPVSEIDTNTENRPVCEIDTNTENIPVFEIDTDTQNRTVSEIDTNTENRSVCEIELIGEATGKEHVVKEPSLLISGIETDTKIASENLENRLASSHQTPKEYESNVDEIMISGPRPKRVRSESLEKADDRQDKSAILRTNSLELKPLPPMRTTSLRKPGDDVVNDSVTVYQVPRSYSLPRNMQPWKAGHGSEDVDKDDGHEAKSSFYSHPNKEKTRNPHHQSQPDSGSDSDAGSIYYEELPEIPPPILKSMSVRQQTALKQEAQDYDAPVMVSTFHLPEIIVTPQEISTSKPPKENKENCSPTQVSDGGVVYDVPVVVTPSPGKDSQGHYDAPDGMVKVNAMEDFKKSTRKSENSENHPSSPLEFCYAFKELLPGIEDYLVRILADEKLSEAAEKQRQYYSERLDVLKLAFPPTLPPRNEGDDYIAQQRELARVRGTLPPPSEFEDGEEYDSVEEPAKVAPPATNFADQDDLYEEPVERTPSAPFSVEERFSDTSYESYDDEEDSGALYINQNFHDHDPSHDPPLPRDDSPLYQNCEPNRNKRKKKDKDGGVPARLLPNVTVFGELYTKGQWSWSKRYCILTEGRLLAFKGENATKSTCEVTLDGYDVMYLEKEAKRSHVMRISRPGCETHFFSAETKDKADQWMEVLTAAACGGSGGSITTSGFNSAASSSPKIDKDADTSISTTTDGVRKSSSLTDLSMTSEGSSGDGTIGQPQSAAQNDKKAAKTDRKGSKPLLDSLSMFFGTLGKRNKEKAPQQTKPKLAEMEEDADPDAVVSGYLMVYSDLMATKKWNKRWCTVKQSILSVYREFGDDAAEFSLPLPGCEVDSACDAKHKMAVKIIEEGKEKITLDMPDTVAQGQWLNVLIHQTGCAEPKTSTSAPPPDNGIYEDEDIYCDVDDTEGDLLKSWNLTKEMGLMSDGSPVKDNMKSNREEAQKPPPLPSAPPPGVSVSKVGNSPSPSGEQHPEVFEDEDIYENIDSMGIQLLNSVSDEGSELYENTSTLSSEYVHGRNRNPGEQREITSEYLHTDNGREVIPYEIYDDVVDEGPTSDYDDVEPNAPVPNTKHSASQSLRKCKDSDSQSLKNTKDSDSQSLRSTKDSASQSLRNMKDSPSQSIKNSKDSDSQSLRSTKRSPSQSVSSASESIPNQDEEEFEETGSELSLQSSEATDENAEEGQKKPRKLSNSVIMKVKALEESNDPEYLKTDKSKQQNRAQRRTSIKRPTEAPPSVPVTAKAGPRRADSDEPKEVVKCHLGPTIDEDRDILEATKNPILVQLRKSRTTTPPGLKTPPSPPSSSFSSIPTSSSATWKDSETDKVDDDIAQAKKRLALIKKKRAEIRSKKLSCADIDTKLRYDDDLRDLLRDQDNAEAALAKLSLRQAELQAQARKAKLEQESLARRESLSRVERQGSFSRVEKSTGEWDLIAKRTGDESPRKFSSGASSPRSNGSGSPAAGRKGNSLDRDRSGTSSSTSSSPKSATLNSRTNGLGGRGSGGRTTRYTSDLTGRTTTRTAVTRTSSLSHGPGSPRGLRVTRSEQEDDDRSPSPRGGRKQVQEKLKLWENISGTSDC